MPVMAWIASAACIFGVLCAVLWSLIRLAEGRGEAKAQAMGDEAALSTAAKVIDAQARPAPNDAQLDGFLRRKREGA